MEKKTLRDFVGKTLHTRDGGRMYIMGLNPFAADTNAERVVVIDRSTLICSGRLLDGRYGNMGEDGGDIIIPEPFCIDEAGPYTTRDGRRAFVCCTYKGCMNAASGCVHGIQSLLNWSETGTYNADTPAHERDLVAKGWPKEEEAKNDD
jgi:hypothetical protein